MKPLKKSQKKGTKDPEKKIFIKKPTEGRRKRSEGTDSGIRENRISIKSLYLYHFIYFQRLYSDRFKKIPLFADEIPSFMGFTVGIPSSEILVEPILTPYGGFWWYLRVLPRGNRGCRVICLQRVVKMSL